MQDKIKFFNIETDNGITTKYGTIEDCLEPSVVLIRGKGRVKAINEQNSYISEVKSFKKNLEKEIEYSIHSSKIFNNEYLAYVELSSKNVSTKRFSYIKYDIYLKPFIPKPLEEMEKDLINISKSINDSLISLLKGNFSLKND